MDFLSRHFLLVLMELLCYRATEAKYDHGKRKGAGAGLNNDELVIQHSYNCRPYPFS